MHFRVRYVFEHENDHFYLFFFISKNNSNDYITGSLKLRYLLQRVEPLGVSPVELLDKNSLATWTIVHLAFE